MNEEKIKEEVFTRLILKYGDVLPEKLGDNFIFVNKMLADVADFTLEEVKKELK